MIDSTATVSSPSDGWKGTLTRKSEAAATAARANYGFGYDEIKHIGFLGIEKEQRWKGYNNPMAECCGGQMMTTFKLTDLGNLAAEYDEIGYVQNVMSDRLTIRYSTSTLFRTKSPGWEPEGIRANEIWYFDHGPLDCPKPAWLSDEPGFVVPLFCPRTGNAPEKVVAHRHIALRTWVAVRTSGDPDPFSARPLFHFDWESEVAIKFEYVENPEAYDPRSILSYKEQGYIRKLHYHFRIFAPKSGLLQDTLRTTAVTGGQGARKPLVGRANAQYPPVINEFWF